MFSFSITMANKADKNIKKENQISISSFYLGMCLKETGRKKLQLKAY